MTTAPRSWRSRSLAALAAGLTALATASPSAHRRDEYLQAARLLIHPERVQIEVDLTPGIALAHAIVAGIDRDQNGLVAADEARAYSARVLGDIRMEIDGQPLRLDLIDQNFPPVPAMLTGEGTIQLQLATTVPPLTAGVHRVRYQNLHRRDIGVYLANALVPSSRRVTVRAQGRDVDQRELVIEYELREGAETPLGWWLAVGVAGMMSMLAGVLWRSWTRYLAKG